MVRYFLALGAMWPGIGLCQELELISPAGDQAETPTYSVSYSIGEVTVATGSNEDDAILTQGFHQSKLSITGIGDPIPAIEMTLYPNPTSDRVVIESSNLAMIKSFTLYDGLGQLILFQENTDVNKAEIDLHTLSNGTYILHSNLKNEEAFLSHQIVKTY